MSLKKKFKKDLTEDADLYFNNNNLESNTKISRSRVGIFTSRIIAAVVLAPLSLAIIAPLIYVLANLKDSVGDVQRRYTLSEIKKLKQGSFRSLNEITYPSTQGVNNFSGAEKAAYANFTNQTYRNLVPETNLMYSPLTLYGFFVDTYAALSKDNLIESYNSIIGLGLDETATFYKKLFENNYFANSEGMIELHNGVFLNNEDTPNQNYIDYLNKVYTECYSMDFGNQKDVETMVEWVNESVGDSKFIKANDLSIDPEMTVAYLFSTMNFDMEWQSKFVKSGTYKGPFQMNDGTVVQTKFMQHTYENSYFDYGKYISVTDRYNYGYTITYLVPKNLEDKIYDLIGDRNIFLEDLDKEKDYANIELHVPKFEITKMFDFKKLISNLGMHNLMGYPNDSLHNMFEEHGGPVYLDTIMQKNFIKLDEDGTKIKSVQMSGVGSAKAMPLGTLRVQLDQPFIYIVKDANGFPIYVGNMDNPTLKD